MGKRKSKGSKRNSEVKKCKIDVSEGEKQEEKAIEETVDIVTSPCPHNSQNAEPGVPNTHQNSIMDSQLDSNDTDSKETDSKDTDSKDTDSKDTDSKETDSKETDSTDEDGATKIKVSIQQSEALICKINNSMSQTEEFGLENTDLDNVCDEDTDSKETDSKDTDSKETDSKDRDSKETDSKDTDSTDEDDATKIKVSMKQSEALISKIKNSISSVREYLSHIKRDFDTVKRDLAATAQRF